MSESAPPESDRADRGRTRSVLGCALVAAILGAAPAGCRSVETPFSRWFGAGSEEDIRRLASIDGVKGPLEHLLARRNADGSASLAPAAGRDEYDKAEAAFKAGKFRQAEKQAKAIARKYKKSPVREDALFLIAEAQFRQKKYSWAQDSYDRLVKDFPSTRYLETRNKRLFTIARYWLQDPSYVTEDDVKLTGFSEDRPKARMKVEKAKRRKSSYDPSRAIPIFPNVWDRTRPVFDTEGRALQALRSIWTHDPTGSLADDALMLTASHYLRKHNYVEADHVYTILRDEYPKSPHNEHAYVLGGFVKQASYLGPEYDDRVLDEARQLKESTLRLYPHHPHKKQLLADLTRIEKAKAAGDWEYVKFYRRKGNKKAMAVYCREIIRNYPQTEYAAKARQVLGEMPAHLRSPAAGAVSPRGPLQKPESEPRLLQVPKISLPKLPRLSLPEFPWGRRDGDDVRPGADDPPGRVHL